MTIRRHSLPGSHRNLNLTVRIPPLVLVFRCLLLILAVSSTARGQGVDDRLSSFVQVDEISPDVNSKLERLERHLQGQRWVEAVDLAQQIMEEGGRRLKLIDSKQLFRHYIPVAQYCSGLLIRYSKTAPELLDRYRKRTDPLARRIYQDAIAARDVVSLERMVDRFFLSSFTDEALLLLGDWALEDGRTDRARRFWERLARETRDGVGQPPWIGLNRDLPPSWPDEWRRESVMFVPGWHYPQPSVAAADIWARLIWASIVEGQFQRARHEWTILNTFHPKVEGRFAGRMVPLAEELLKILDAAPSENRQSFSVGWPTFAGQVNRNGLASHGTDLSGGPVWSITFPETRVETRPPRLGESQQLLIHFPIVVGKTVFLHQHGTLRALDLRTGRARFGALHVGDEQDPGTIGMMIRLPDHDSGRDIIGYDRFTATAAGSWLALRSGLRVTYENADALARLPSDLRCKLVVLDLLGQGRLVDGFPRIPSDSKWTFDGVPLLDGNRLYVAMRRVDDVRPRLSVACFEVPGARLLWRQFVAAASTIGGGQMGEMTHTLLTLSSDQIIVNTNLGAVAALRCRDGQLRWLVRYPRADYPVLDPDRTDEHFQRDLVPCIAANGLAYVMPTDSRRLFALDMATGWLQWAAAEDSATDAKYLLGVTDAYLFASGDTLYWFDAMNGKKRAQFPPPYKHALGFARNAPKGFGRGVLAGDRVLWTSRDNLYVFYQGKLDTVNGVTTPLFAQAPISLRERGATGGNLVAVDNMLLIAGPDTLYAFRRQVRHPLRQ
jgi:outer membrane protein assembly factor BamB